MSEPIQYDATFTEQYRVRVLETAPLPERNQQYIGQYGMVVIRFNSSDVVVQFEDTERLLFSSKDVEVAE